MALGMGHCSRMMRGTLLEKERVEKPQDEMLPAV